MGLRGTQKDWVAMKQKLIALLKTKVTKEFGKRWGDAVLPVLDRFIDAFDGKIDCLFWNSMLRRGASGGDSSSAFIRCRRELRREALARSRMVVQNHHLIIPGEGTDSVAFQEWEASLVEWEV